MTTTVRRYQPRPDVHIDAAEWTGDYADMPDEWKAMGGIELDAHGRLIVNTLEGPARALIGSFIARGTRGEFYPIRSDVFTDKYAPVGGDV